MIQNVPDVVVQAALSYTQTTTLTDALLALLDVEIKHCADETCQKEFLFQDQNNRIRNVTGTRRPRNDAQYCSDICARRAVQRVYVRRKRAKIKKGE